MMRRLTLLRHAQAESQASTGADLDRTLSLRGRAQAEELGALLTAETAVPELVLCSAANRAVQTWTLIAASLEDAGGPGSTAIEVRRPPELYGADPVELLDLVRALPADLTSVLVVGHEPVISHVARTLAGPESEEAALDRIRTGMSTAMLAFLRTQVPWAGLARGQARLVGLAQPDAE